MKKAVGIIITLIVILALGGAGYFWIVPSIMEGSSGAGTDIVYVQSVDEILNGFVFMSNRYSGVVETEEVVAVEADADKKIKTTFVKEGDEVKKGDKLFEYDIDEMQIQLDQDKLDVEQAKSEIKAYNAQIESLEKEKKTATTNRQLLLSNQIDAAKIDLKRAEYNQTTLENEIEKLERSIKNNVVKASVDGTVQSVNDPTLEGYVRIASNGDYRIKAVVSEENIYEFFEDEPILIRSRLDEEVTWTGLVTAIDTAKPINDTNMYGTETTTKYPVYISLDSTDGLLIGQHVTVEMLIDFGEEKDGLWLDEYYIADIDSKPYVWAEADNNTIEKRFVELGEYDENMFKYEILSGITEEDFIAFPEDRIVEGMKTTYNPEDVVYDYDFGDDFMGDFEGELDFEYEGEFAEENLGDVGAIEDEVVVPVG